MRKFRSLHKRLALAVALTSLLIALIVGLLAFAAEYRGQFAQARALQDQLVATVQNSAAVAAFAGNEQIADEVIEGLLANPIVATVHIESLNGFSRSRARPGDDAGGENIDYPLLSPVDHSERIGQLGVRQNRHEINARAQNAALRYAALMTLQIAISAGLLMLLFGQLIGRPLTDVARMLEALPPGSHQRIVLPKGHDHNEIGMLVHSANALLDAVEQAIIDERSLQAEVDEMQSHYKRIFETTNVGIMILRPSGGLINCNPTLMSRIVGVHFDSADPDDCRNFIDTIFEQPSRAWAMVLEARDSGETVAADLQLKDDDGVERWAHCMISVTVDATGDIELIEGILYDVTKRRQHETEARRAAELDALTGLPNRRGMNLFIDRALRHAETDGGSLGLMLMDLDGFKAVNDTHGHAAGDIVLKVVAERLARQLRQATDLVARLGGDEFTLAIHDCDKVPGLLERIAGEIIARVGEPIPLEDGTLVKVGASIGMARYPAHGNNRDALLEAADAAMYQVKRRGKNNYALFDPDTPAA